MHTCRTVEYAIGDIPSNIALTRVRPSIWISAMEVTWTVLTFCLSRASSGRIMYVLRFFIGLAESTIYLGMQYILGSWYRREELAKRSCISQTSGAIATMFNGYQMAGVYRLNRKRGCSSWTASSRCRLRLPATSSYRICPRSRNHFACRKRKWRLRRTRWSSRGDRTESLA